MKLSAVNAQNTSFNGIKDKYNALDEKQKKNVKIGAAIAGTVAVIGAGVGAYKYGKAVGADDFLSKKNLTELKGPRKWANNFYNWAQPKVERVAKFFKGDKAKDAPDASKAPKADAPAPKAETPAAPKAETPAAPAAPAADAPAPKVETPAAE